MMPFLGFFSFLINYLFLFIDQIQTVRINTLFVVLLCVNAPCCCCSYVCTHQYVLDLIIMLLLSWKLKNFLFCALRV
uniref:Uncharacterized protein n=1 Tax=Arundo donax TaxID=35708 RepID=A0A0A9BPL6_ARUDO